MGVEEVIEERRWRRETKGDVKVARNKTWEER